MISKQKLKTKFFTNIYNKGKGGRLKKKIQGKVNLSQNYLIFHTIKYNIYQSTITKFAWKTIVGNNYFEWHTILISINVNHWRKYSLNHSIRNSNKCQRRKGRLHFNPPSSTYTSISLHIFHPPPILLLIPTCCNLKKTWKKKEKKKRTCLYKLFIKNTI